MKEIDWRKAPEGAQARCPENELVGIYQAWYKKDAIGLVEQICPDAGLNTWTWMGGRRDYPVGAVLRPQEIKPSQDQQWSGEGLPPVGSACEVNDERVGLWEKVDEVLAHSRIAGKDVAVFQIGDYIAYSPADRFRPVRTPEQVAAAEREKAIEDIASILDGIWSSEREAAGFLYDAGYRKQVQP